MGNFIPIKAWSDEEQPREKLIKKGRAAMSNAELIAILLSTGTSNKSALDLAVDILNKGNNDIRNLATWTIKDFCKVDGIGLAKAATIVSAIELSGRKLQAELKNKTTIQSSKDAYQWMRHSLEDLTHEEFWVLTLNRKNAIIAEHRISEGGITATIVDQRKIFRLAIDDKSTGIILFHNHPSGNTMPSEADNQLTRKLKEGGKLLDINVLDHLIISQEGYYSYADNGTL
jgi:DNA repair protein RadC